MTNPTHKRVKVLAASRKTRLNTLIEKFTKMALTEFDAENRFIVMAGKGNKRRELELLNKLQHYYDDK